MSPNAPIYLLCDLCDYKGTVRAPDGRGLTNRVPCTECGGKKFMATQLTIAHVNAVIQERDRLRAELGAIVTNLDEINAELARRGAAASPAGPGSSDGATGHSEGPFVVPAEAACDISDEPEGAEETAIISVES